MSFDLLVFDPEVAPRNRDDFISWYQELTKWGEDRNYDSSEKTTGNIKPFYDRLRRHYPPLNGPNAYRPSPNPAGSTSRFGWLGGLLGAKKSASAATPRFNEAFLTDYSIAESAIYMAFSWSINAEAYSSVVETAIATGVGFFDVSAERGVILHDREELLKLNIL